MEIPQPEYKSGFEKSKKHQEMVVLTKYLKVISLSTTVLDSIV